MYIENDSVIISLYRQKIEHWYVNDRKPTTFLSIRQKVYNSNYLYEPEVEYIVQNVTYKVPDFSMM